MDPTRCQVILITGTSSGFGLLTAVSLARRGHRVFASMRNLDKAAKLKAAAEKAGLTIGGQGPITLVPLDVTRPETGRAAVQTVLRSVGRLDALVNNAGIGTGGFFEDMTEQELRDTFETNFFGAVALMREVIPHMRERKSGKIINVTSISGRVPLPGMSAYSSSKFALEAVSEVLRYELGPFGVRIVVVEPGTFGTEIFSENRRTAKGSSNPASPYRTANERLIEKIYERALKNGRDPQDVADRIVRVVESNRPRLRYTVGPDAKAEALLRWSLPHAVPDTAVRLFLRRFGLGR
ncbi:MAG: SDR family oxidoreductase [Nitrospirae bacterium]|nr:SDR family oxidoreductase [Nitrospirota bacterium]